jgi:hypothetical protein
VKKLDGENNMNDVTILIQGKILKQSYDFFIKNYLDFPVIISTWVDTDIEFNDLPNNFVVILSPYPDERGEQNLNLQIVSTLAGLEKVKTKYVIKIRGDEYWSNLYYIYNLIKNKSEKIFTSPIYFRAWQFAEYHISDHIIAGLTNNVSLMFTASKNNFTHKRLNVSKIKEDGKFLKYHPTHSPEERITKSYLEIVEKERFEKVDGRILMKEHFEIIDISMLKPYKAKANLYGAEWDSNFIPEDNFSLSNIDKLFSAEPYKK